MLRPKEGGPKRCDACQRKLHRNKPCLNLIITDVDDTVVRGRGPIEMERGVVLWYHVACWDESVLKAIGKSRGIAQDTEEDEVR